MAYCTNSGSLYENSSIKELKVGNSTECKIQATGTGSFQVIGKLTANGATKVLKLVNLSDFNCTDTITNTDIFTCDVSGLYSISVQNASGFTKVFATLLCN